jgi:hypothetical protein
MKRFKMHSLLSVTLLLVAASCSTDMTDQRVKSEGPEVVDFRVLPLTCHR